MKEIKWSKEEENILLNNYKIIGIIKCSELLNKSKSAIFRKYQELTGKMDRKHVEWQKEQIEWLIQNYPPLGSYQCSKILKINKLQVEIKAQNLGLKRDFNTAPNGFKVCSICKETKPELEFGWQLKNKNILKCTCKLCETLYHRAAKEKRLNNKDYRFKMAKKQLLNGAKYRARNKGLDFDLDIEWVEKNMGLVCPVTGIEYHLADGSGKVSQESPSIDRIDNSKGYIKSNCIIVSLKANTTKNICSWKEIRKIADFYQNLEKERNPIDYEI